MAEPKISVVMPVYNSSHFLKDSINSILTQSFSNFEFIIINDGSTDNSLELINSFQHKDERIIVINQKHQGITKSLNTGIQICQGEFIVRMDADDIAFDTRLKQQLDFIKKHPDIDIVGSQIVVINEKNKIIKEIKNLPLDDTLIKWDLIFGTPLLHPTLLIRKTVFNKFGIFNDQFAYGQDLLMWRRIAKNIKFANLPDKLMKIRHSETSYEVDKVKCQKSIRISTLNQYLKNVCGINFRQIKEKQLNDFFISGKPVFTHYNNFMRLIMGIRKGFISLNCNNSKITKKINQRISLLFLRAFLLNSHSALSQLMYLTISVAIYPSILFKKKYWWHIKQGGLLHLR
ncbi:MAG: glycosyltransferase [Candidatus Marinimicrobia bacterium]|jgi:glycosyltransferase involved in cell wall biosynthesis|nr:glycosyltransferase [Candidatus Neomarinimicrobiota bacterium]